MKTELHYKLLRTFVQSPVYRLSSPSIFSRGTSVPQAASSCDAIRAVTVNRNESNMAVGTSSGRVIEVRVYREEPLCFHSFAPAFVILRGKKASTRFVHLLLNSTRCHDL